MRCQDLDYIKSVCPKAFYQQILLGAQKDVIKGGYLHDLCIYLKASRQFQLGLIPMMWISHYHDSRIDTAKMAIRLGKKVNLLWSEVKWSEKHDEYSKLISRIELTETPNTEIPHPNWPGVKWIKSSKRLALEGYRQNNCAASYKNSVESGDCYIGSVVMNGNRITIEVETKLEDGKAKIVQAEWKNGVDLSSRELKALVLHLGSISYKASGQADRHYEYEEHIEGGSSWGGASPTFSVPDHIGYDFGQSTTHIYDTVKYSHLTSISNGTFQGTWCVFDKPDAWKTALACGIEDAIRPKNKGAINPFKSKGFSTYYMGILQGVTERTLTASDLRTALEKRYLP